MYPGCGRTGVGLEGYTGTHPGPIPGPVFSHIPEIVPTHGQMKAFLEVSPGFSDKGPRLTSD